MVNKNLLGGKTTYPEKWWSVQVSWDDDYSWMDSHKIPWFQTTNQWTYFGEINLHSIVVCTKSYIQDSVTCDFSVKK